MNKQQAIEILKAILYGLQKSKSIAIENDGDSKLHDFMYPNGDRFTEKVADRIDKPSELTALDALNIIRWVILKRQDVVFLASGRDGYPEIKVPDDLAKVMKGWNVEVTL